MTYSSGLSDAFQSRRDIDAVTHQIAIAFLDNVTKKMNANAKFNAPLWRQASVTLDPLNLDGATNSFNDASKFNNGSIACVLHHVSLVDRDCGINQVTRLGSLAQRKRCPVYPRKPTHRWSLTSSAPGQEETFASVRLITSQFGMRHISVSLASNGRERLKGNPPLPIAAASARTPMQIYVNWIVTTITRPSCRIQDRRR